ncbi:cell division protein ZapE [Jongsikchunia kroppenstedtii]|uniref:cell division protein ZapE n=1 Tax=Jongsikchunia kroppenstedtii TaxID=1121721 RepID=UPI0009D9F7E6|nr:cell division protein ZapE [Jongsikchunia kroppenstedtii]
MRISRLHRSGGAAHPLAAAAGQRFLAEMAGSGIEFDPGQQAAIAEFGVPTRHGYYLWGSVGRGKSMIADGYFRAIPTRHKRRLHFHDFFHELHTEITSSRTSFDITLDRFLGKTRAILFDEFHVHDVADGVYLAATLRALVAHDTLILATSNYAPAALMPNPYFHQGFEPTITLIESTLNVVNLADGEDYRRGGAGEHGSGFASGTWCIGPRGAEPRSHSTINAAGQYLQAHSIPDDTVAFDFRELCVRPLGIDQYRWIAERFAGVTVTDVPDLATVAPDPLLRLGNLVDVLYDNDIRLDVVAIGTPEGILTVSTRPRDAARTVSRLSMLVRS